MKIIVRGTKAGKAHTYQRLDKPRGEYFHTNWTGRGGDVTSTVWKKRLASRIGKGGSVQMVGQTVCENQDPSLQTWRTYEIRSQD